MNEQEIKTQDHVSSYYEEVRYQKPYSWLYHSWWFKKMIDLGKPEGWILDDGCGTGHFAEFIKSDKVVGLDISKGMLERAKKKLQMAVCGDAEDLPFKNETFDCVFARALLHHLPEPKNGTEEIRRVLKKGGRAVFCDTLFSVLSDLPRRIANKTEHFSEEHKNLKESEIIGIISPYLKIKKIYYFGYIAYPLLGFPDMMDLFKFFPFKMFLAKVLIKIDELIGMIPFVNKQAWGIIVVAEK